MACRDLDGEERTWKRGGRNTLTLLLESRRLTWLRRGEGRAPSAARALPRLRGAAAREPAAVAVARRAAPAFGFAFNKDHEQRLPGCW